jgi:hypothetical protein
VDGTAAFERRQRRECANGTDLLLQRETLFISSGVSGRG